jgi:hypothetical protein
MILKIPNKDKFVSTFLSPLSKVNDSCVIKIDESGYNCLLSSVDGGLILYCLFKNTNEVTEERRINVPDIGRLIKILQCIDEDIIELEFDDNSISYKSQDIRFKYHLLEDGIISSPAINIDKIKSIEYNCAFELTSTSFINLIKSSTFASETDKIYFSTKEDRVYGELTDHQKHNSDSVTRCLSENFTGDGITDSIPVPFDVIRIIAGNRADKINVLINTTLSILTFEVNIKDVKNVYVVTGLVKT